MKPIKNRFHCEECGRAKMLFPTKKEAELFLQYNADAIEAESGKRPVRIYYCKSCQGWHITSRKYSFNLKELTLRFGEEDGMKMYNKVGKVVGYRKPILPAIRKKIKELWHNLKYEVIHIEKCQALISGLIDVFEVVLTAQLEDKIKVKELFNRFKYLCNVFSSKKELLLSVQ